MINHLAIIMDGNGRWAEARGLTRSDGHRAGARQIGVAARAAMKAGIKYLTLYAFSTENWKRPKEEVNALMALLKKFLAKYLKDFKKNDIRLKISGRLQDLSLELQQQIKSAIAETADNKSGTLVIALNYGGRAELTDSVKKIVEKVQNNELLPDDITEDVVSANLYNPDVPDPELLIRTSGELRISNFLLWELAYTEFFITDVLWPDFSEEVFVEAIESFKNRNRRKGGL